MRSKKQANVEPSPKKPNNLFSFPLPIGPSMNTPKATSLSVLLASYGRPTIDCAIRSPSRNPTKDVADLTAMGWSVSAAS